MRGLLHLPLEDKVLSAHGALQGHSLLVSNDVAECTALLMAG